MMNTLINLTNYGLLKVNGSDAKKLLQGQLTCDIEKITANESCLGAHCNPQGRVISLFRVFLLQEAYYLLMLRSMVPIALAALKKYAVFYKVELSDASNSLTIAGCSKAPDNLLPADKISIIHASSRYLVIGSNEPTLNIKDEWLHLDISEGIPAIYPETSGAFLPHEINLHQLNAISFDKGCYTGQEIIARMHYRGKLKNHMYTANIMHEVCPLPGQTIYCLRDESTQAVGTIVDSYPLTPDNYQTLILIDQSNAKNQHLFLDRNHHHFFTFEDE